MGNKQQTPRVLLELAEESLTTMTEHYYKECIVKTDSQSEALAMFFKEPESSSTNETKGDGTDLPQLAARKMLTQTLTSIISALLGRPISQASNKDRRATDEEKEAIANLLSNGATVKDGKKTKLKNIESGLIDKMVTNMMLFDLEAKKALVTIMQTLVRESKPFRTYVTSSGSDDPTGLSPIVEKLVHGFEVKSFSSKYGIALFTGPMLMTIVRNDERTAKTVLENHLDRFLDEFVQSTSYEIKGIAFDTLRDLLFTVDENETTFLRKNAADYINGLWVPSLEAMKAENNINKPASNRFFTKLNVLLGKRDFTTVKATVKIIQSVLFCTSKVTFDSMLTYVGDPHNCIVAMNLLRDTSAQLQFEGFHLFKVFVLNPNRPSTITILLARNKGNLVTYLGKSNFSYYIITDFY
jgi:calcium binding protein 39